MLQGRHKNVICPFLCPRDRRDKCCSLNISIKASVLMVTYGQKNNLRETYCIFLKFSSIEEYVFVFQPYLCIRKMYVLNESEFTKVGLINMETFAERSRDVTYFLLMKHINIYNTKPVQILCTTGPISNIATSYEMVIKVYFLKGD